MQIGLLGPLEIRTDDGGLLEVPGARLRALLITLALEPGRAVPKTKLVDWIWGEQPPADATNALQALVSRLRRVLPDGSLDVQAGGYRLVVDPGTVDAVRFDQLLDRARSGDDAHRARLLREALDLWRGAPMQDLGDGADVVAVITRFDGLRLAAMEDLYEAEIRLGRGPELVAELTDLVAQRPVRERLAGALMRALGAAGRGPEALTVYQRTREALADELGVDPSPELSALHVALLRGEVGARTEERITNLRAELTSFVGKHADIAAVRELLAAHRLTTVTGPGGSGKTRLAVETARTMLGDLPDGAWLVELAGADGSSDLAQSALAAFGLRDALLGSAPNAEPMDRLIAAIRDRETLLILDNCEHIIEAAAAFAHHVLGECTRLRILATSREPLGITGEALWQVEPLALPATNADPDAIESSPAVALLRDRASAVCKDLADDAGTSATMARICRALDGIPLAIELAAARLRTMSLDQLAHRLDDRFRLLTGGSRTAIPQHRTLRAVVDWSWELLSDAERLVLRRLAVFAGGASLEAAEQVCADNNKVEQWEVLELLTTLTEKSLLLVTADDSPRFRMLETIKQYAADRLAESGEAEAARRAHLDYFTGLAATAEPHLRRAEQLAWLAVLEAEHDNLAVAMRGALASGDAAGAMRLAAAAGWYWWLGGHKGEGTELVIAATELPGEVDDETKAVVYGLVVHFVSSGRNDEQQVADWIRKAHRFGRDVDGGHPALRFTAALERMLGGPHEFLPAFESVLHDDDPWVRALARLQLGKLRTVLGHAGSEPDEFFAQALTEFRALGERWGMSFALTELANRIAMRGEFVRAVTLFDEAIAVVTEVGALEDVVAMRARQAQLYQLLGRTEESAAALAEAQRCADQTGWPTVLAEVALTRAELARCSGDTALAHQQIDLARALFGSDAEQPNISAIVHVLLGCLTEDLAEATTHYDAAFQAASATGHAPLMAHVLVGIADLALRAEQYEQAARLLAASNAARGLPDRSHPDVAGIEQTARHHLGDQGFTEAMRKGAVADRAELIAVTLAS
ncbi:BTAD domain-containing putative transcriptional regulator [Nocardia donostiensis]|uniref:AfsR family transcriptional regulator n=1 Tax=Nocardia donostiensis TaxID=1538463 RepID=A0A1V2TJR9_9NOCA|nr:BTAD domain-containing putative transcriptional regulator [Nocardia donostiensis]ONM49769.1 AfsR family transcriptional regulator [Nocardia donostiensis]OQS15346.1 AfsR family transcriptional regulator [Nocardia donostiensis]OQS19862.1 AfsR family transcriptional regulator [Nocardia donostiensis]